MNTRQGIPHNKKTVSPAFNSDINEVKTGAAYATAKDFTSDTPIKLPRIIPVPKTGGFLPIVPIFAGLSAAGSLAGGAAAIAKAINAYKTAKKQLLEAKRHNKEMEALFIGRGLHIKHYKDGLGIYTTVKKN
ncbi:unnamed protein product [Arctia plantaginis]|uniref:Uncharacterized protein n=1 Tax=Arctia plantaginis TaxID=874455 RepID=A0A8S1B3H1_ARCPL|nr:unnamed protein product [Arctia plantaginis]